MFKIEILKRLSEIRKNLTGNSGDCIYSNKEIIKLICRGFSNSKITRLAIEQYYYWDHPTYWNNREHIYEAE